MSLVQPTPEELQTFRSIVESKLGLSFNEHSPKSLREVLNAQCQRLGAVTASYLAELAQKPLELRHLAQSLTVNESYFFRHRDQLMAYRDVALTETARVRGALPIRIASMGCASGEEPYSLAMLAFTAGLNRLRLEITGFDINPQVLESARRGRYSSWSLRETPPEMRTRWFRQEHREFVLERWIRDAVTFKEANLAEPKSPAFAPESYDIIFCRNVLMYFSSAKARSAVEALSCALAPGGYLFLGHAECLRSDWLGKLTLLSSHNSFYYRKPSGHLLPIKASLKQLSDPRPGVTKPENVLQVSSRPLSKTDLDGHQKLSQARRLFECERFNEAYRTLLEGDDSLLERPEAILLCAVVLVHLGELEQAEKTCQRLQHRQGASAGLHYVLALCQQERQNFADAARQHRRSTELDPTFAMPRLQLGLLAQKQGDGRLARREFEIARELLHRETLERLQLFSAGFGREALLEICERAIS